MSWIVETLARCPTSSCQGMPIFKLRACLIPRREVLNSVRVFEVAWPVVTLLFLVLTWLLCLLTT